MSDDKLSLDADALLGEVMELAELNEKRADKASSEEASLSMPDEAEADVAGEILDDLDAFLEDFGNDSPKEEGAATEEEAIARSLDLAEEEIDLSADADEEVEAPALTDIVDPEELNLALEEDSDDLLEPPAVAGESIELDLDAEAAAPAEVEELDLDAGTAPDETKELDLDADELDLSFDEPEAPLLEDSVEPAPEVESKPVPEPVHEPQRAATPPPPEPAPVSSPAHQPLTPEAPSAAANGRSPLALAAAAIAVVATLLAAGGFWMVSSLQGEVEALRQQLAAVEPSVGTQAGSDPRIDQIAVDVGQLNSRLGELAVIIEGPLSHLQEQSSEMFAELDQRLAKLESQPVVSKNEKPAAKKPALVDKPEPVAGNWVVNLLSVTEASAADRELRKLRDLGIKADKQRVSQEGKSWYRLRVGGFTSRDEANRYVAEKLKPAGILQAWVGRL